MSIIHRDDVRICFTDCGQKGCVCKTRITKFNPIEDENNWVRKNFDIEEILDFQSKHRVEVIMGSDYQYECWIDYKEGDGCYGSSLTPLHALITGIKIWNNE